MINSRMDDRYNPASRPAAAGMRFPIGALIGWLVLFVIGARFVYRLSETGGRASEVACLAAIIVSGLAAAAGVVPIVKVWGRELVWGMLGVFLSGAIRLLIGLAGVAIIIFFTAIQRTRFVGYLTLFYVPLLGVDTWLALWMLRHSAQKRESQDVVHGNVWDVIVRAESARRSGQ